MNIFSQLLGSSKIVDAAIKTGDALFHTDEEKAEYRLKLMKAYEPFKLAQRLLMLIICIPYMMGWVITFAASFWIYDIGAQIELLTDTKAAIAFALAVGFYFGGGMLEGAMRAKK